MTATPPASATWYRRIAAALRTALGSSLAPILRRPMTAGGHAAGGGRPRGSVGLGPLLSSVAASADSAIIVTDAGGRIAWVNEGFVRLSGFAAFEAVGRPPVEVLAGPAADAPARALLHRAIRDADSIRFETVLRRKDQSEYWAVLDGKPLRGRTGVPGGYVLFAFDVTERKRAEQRAAIATRRLLAATEAGGVGVWEWTVGAPTIWLDPIARRLLALGDGDEPVAHERLLLQVHPADRGALIVAWQHRVRDQGELRLRFRTAGPGGSRHLRLAGMFELDEEFRPVRLTGVVLDETRAVQAHELLLDEKGRTEAALLRGESLQYALDEHAHVVVTDLDGCIVYVNDRQCVTSGYRRDELIGQSFRIELPESHSEAQIEAVRARINAGRVWRGEMALRSKSGRLYWTETTIVPFKRPDGTIERFVTIRTDITERKLAEERLVRQDALFRTTSRIARVGGWEYELATDRFEWSEVAAEIYDLPWSEVPRIEWLFERYPQEVRAEVERGWRSALTDGRAFDFTWRVATPAGEQRWIRAIGEPHFTDGKCARMVGVVQDVSQERTAALALSEAKDAAEAASRAKGEFLANMSHELRTPLNAVIGMSGLLLDTPLSAEQREYAEIARSSGESLLSLIKDILDLSKVETGHLELEDIDFDLRAVVDEAVDAVALRAAEKQIELLIDIDRSCPTSCRGDPTRLRQVLLNLLSNAVKFTERGEVLLSIEPSPAPEGRLGLIGRVRDTGIGIPADQLARLFRPFSQADASTTRRHGGTGLGLSICKRLSEAMGGGISVASTPGAGSCFTFQVLLGMSALPEPEPFPWAQLRLAALLVEGHPANRRILAGQLESLGFTVDAAGSAEEALECWDAARIRGHALRIAIVDQQLPGREGTWLAGEIRRRDPEGNCRLVLLSSLASRIEGDAKGRFDRVLTKPVKRDALTRALAELVGERRGLGAELSPMQLGFEGRSVLLAEDNPVNQKLAVRLLAPLGLKVTVAQNGREALECLRQERFDAVLMDCQMPELDGYAATRALRAGECGPANQSAPVIAMTAHALSGDREACMAAGMSDYVPKPVESARLRQALERAFGVAAAQPSAATAAPGGDVAATDTLDLDELMHQLDGDHGFVVELLGTFLNSGASLVSQVLDPADPAVQRRAAHQLKGSAGNVRATRLARAAAAVERCAGAVGPELTEQVRIAWDVTQSAARAALGTLATGLDGQRSA